MGSRLILTVPPGNVIPINTGPAEGIASMASDLSCQEENTKVMLDRFITRTTPHIDIQATGCLGLLCSALNRVALVLSFNWARSGDLHCGNQY